MKQKYIIEMDDKDAVPLEIQFTEFMGNVFDAAKESNLIGYGLNITRVEVEK